MRRRIGHRRAGSMVVLAAALALAPLALAPGGAGATVRSGTAAAAPHKLVQIGHGTFWMCKKKTTQYLVAVNTLTLHPGQSLAINFIVRNQGAAACNYVAPYASVTPGPTAPTLQAGPCGSVGFEILGAHRRNVWPGPQSFNCPALGFAQLQPGATVSGTGVWTQAQPGSSARVPVGSYTLVVDGHFSFPITVAAH